MATSVFSRRDLLAGAAALILPPALAVSSAFAGWRELDPAALEARHGGRIGVCAMSEGGIVKWRAGERFPYCSTFKLFLAASVMERVQDGLEKLDRAVPIAESDMVPHAPVTGPAVGSSLTIMQLLKATVEVSDNPAANILFREMGGLEVFQKWYRSIGDRITRVDRNEVALNSALPGDHRDTTTPQQCVANLHSVLRRSLLSAGHLEMLEKWLTETPTGTLRIKAAVPANYKVGHKTGTGAQNTRNDIGIIWPPRGAPILIAVFFTGARNAAPEELDAIVAGSARAALQELGHG